MINAMCFSSLEQKLSGTLHGDDVSFENLSIDSRRVSEGDVYLALKGENFDGHDFIDSALEKGCTGVVVEHYAANTGGADISYLTVNDTKQALADIASLNRDEFCGKLVGLTGSAGKTSTKNMLASIFSQFGETTATKGNFNNEIGVPLTLLDIEKQHQYAVVEMGARKHGDITYLSNMAKPDVAMVLNAGSAHIEIFGSYEAIVETKGEIYDSLAANGIGVINFDDPAYLTWLKRLGDRRSLSFSSESENSDVYATQINCGSEGSTFTLHYLQESHHVMLPVPGLHQIQNALAAATCAIAVGCSLPGIAQGLQKVASSEGRMDMTKCGDITILDDSYNANPVSMKAALDVLAMQAGYRVAVLGEMAELGAYASDAHLDVAEYVGNSEIEEVCLIGPFAQMMKDCIGRRASVFETKALLAAHLVAEGPAEKVVMIKGSRSTALDEIVDLIKGRAH